MKSDTHNPDNSLHQILVVDDEEIVLVALRETLRREGYQVDTTTDAVAAIELVRKNQYAAIITDQMMPTLSGLELLAQVKEIQPDATRILITAVLSLSTVIDAINKGEIYRFIVKPWLREELLVTVRNAVQRYELIMRNAVLQATSLSMNEKLAKLNKSLEEQVARGTQQNRRLNELNAALAENLTHSVELCLNVMQTFYPQLGTQARRTYAIAMAMADSLKLGTEDRHVLEYSALLHDIGLVGVPRNLIKKWQESPDALGTAERALIQQHPVLGEELVRFMHHLEPVGRLIRSHHERYDGSGYPDGLRAEEIPQLGRLLAVAVAYAESFESDQDSLDHIRHRSGSEFDPDAVRLLLRCQPKAAVPRKEREVLLSELEPGMVVARGIYTSKGILLIPEGQSLTDASIEKMKNHHRISPISQTLLVYC
ncbi:MAG TPA: two-component system response regulator [Verrucomicrobiales bacterium]|nr:two-component system response regulator [Verrucomicrobiales bacterium]